MIKRITQIIAFCLLSVCAHASDVTFTVDMSCYTGDLSAGVTLNGSFNGWCGDCNPLMNNGDGTWSVTIDLPDGFTEFKFTVGAWLDQEVFAGGEDCTLTTGANVNRTITVVPGVNTYSAGWNSCDENCIDNPPVVVEDVTFTVDMSCYAGTVDLADGVFLNGTFNGWCGTCNPLTNNGDGTWSVTIPLDVADIEFKFTVAGWTDQEVLTEGDACTLTTDGFTNRVYTIVEGGPNVITAGWNTCDGDCSTALPMQLISFDVAKEGMDAQIEWTTEGDDSENMFVVEYSRDAVNFQEIGTVYGNTTDLANTYNFKHYQLVNGENYYRLKNIDNSETVRFSDLRSLEVAVVSNINITPTLSSTSIAVRLDDSQLENVFTIYNILGEKMFEQNITDTYFSVEVNGFPIGQYIAVIQNGDALVTERFVKVN